MMMKRAEVESCLTCGRFSQRALQSGTKYGGSDGWSADCSEPSNWLTSACRRSCAMSRIRRRRRASASACKQTNRHTNEEPVRREVAPPTCVHIWVILRKCEPHIWFPCYIINDYCLIFVGVVSQIVIVGCVLSMWAILHVFKVAWSNDIKIFQN